MDIRTFDEVREWQEVDVLLATLNGEAFIAEFLESLRVQIGVKINLFVSDDGSTDKTIEILNDYRGCFLSFHLIHGPRMGPASNFFNLLQFSSADFICFADQDDVWLPYHIKDSLSEIDLDETIPSLVFSKCFQFNHDTQEFLGFFPILEETTGLEAFMFQNFARGCTFVFNRALRNLIIGRRNESALMHDWWRVLVALTCGKVSFLNTVTTLYRVHSGNHIGISSQRNLLQRIRNNLNHELVQQLRGVYLDYGEIMHPIERNRIQNVLSIIDSNMVRRFIGIIKFRHRFRQTFLSEVYLRIRLLIRR